MNAEIQKILNLSHFYKINRYSESMKVELNKPSLMLYNNIKTNWLQYTKIKTNNQLLDIVPANTKQLMHHNAANDNFVENFNVKAPAEISLKFIDKSFEILNPIELKLNVLFPKQDIMQYFTKWQRYRKYWWSSITTTPSLLLIDDMKHQDNLISVNIIANFSWGQHIVESLRLSPNGSSSNSNSCLVCTMVLENALLTLLLDGQSNATKEGYLRLHAKMAPYKISFGLNSEDTSIKSTLQELAQLMNYQLTEKEISTLMPDFSLPLSDQIKENLGLGITYTAILNDTTLKDGIFHLLNSNTMLKEQVHVADFINYACRLCNTRPTISNR